MFGGLSKHCHTLFALMLYASVNNFSVMLGCTNQRIKCLAQ